MLEGLEGAAASAGQPFDRGRMEQTARRRSAAACSCMNNVHEDAAGGVRDALGAVVPARAARHAGDQAPDGGAEARRAAGTIGSAGSPVGSARSAPAPQHSHPRHRTGTFSTIGTPSTTAPVLSCPGIDAVFFLPVRGCRACRHAARLRAAAVRRRPGALRGPEGEGGRHAERSRRDAPSPTGRSRWTGACRPTPLRPVATWSRSRRMARSFAPLPRRRRSKAKSYDAWTEGVRAWIYARASSALLRSAELGVDLAPRRERRGLPRPAAAGGARAARPGGGRAAPAVRRRIARLQDRLRRAQEAREREQSQASTGRSCRPPSRSGRRCSAPDGPQGGQRVRRSAARPPRRGASAGR